MLGRAADGVIHRRRPQVRRQRRLDGGAGVQNSQTSVLGEDVCPSRPCSGPIGSWVVPSSSEAAAASDGHFLQ